MGQSESKVPENRKHHIRRKIQKIGVLLQDEHHKVQEFHRAAATKHKDSRLTRRAKLNAYNEDVASRAGTLTDTLLPAHVLTQVARFTPEDHEVRFGSVFQVIPDPSIGIFIALTTEAELEKGSQLCINIQHGRANYNIGLAYVSRRFITPTNMWKPLSVWRRDPVATPHVDIAYYKHLCYSHGRQTTDPFVWTSESFEEFIRSPHYPQLLTASLFYGAPSTNAALYDKMFSRWGGHIADMYSADPDGEGRRGVGYDEMRFFFIIAAFAENADALGLFEPTFITQLFNTDFAPVYWPLMPAEYSNPFYKWMHARAPNSFPKRSFDSFQYIMRI